jgi:hypothetical protein
VFKLKDISQVKKIVNGVDIARMIDVKDLNLDLSKQKVMVAYWDQNMRETFVLIVYRDCDASLVDDGDTGYRYAFCSVMELMNDDRMMLCSAVSYKDTIANTLLAGHEILMFDEKVEFAKWLTGTSTAR